MLDGRGRSSETGRWKRFWAYIPVPSGDELSRLSIHGVSGRGRGTTIWQEAAIGGWIMRKCSRIRAAEGSPRPGTPSEFGSPPAIMDGLGKNCLRNCLSLDLQFWPFGRGKFPRSRSGYRREGARDGLAWQTALAHVLPWGN